MVGNHCVWMNLNPSTKHNFSAVNMATQRTLEAPLDHPPAATDLSQAIHWSTALCSALTLRKVNDKNPGDASPNSLRNEDMAFQNEFKKSAMLNNGVCSGFLAVTQSSTQTMGNSNPEDIPKTCHFLIDFAGFGDSFSHFREIHCCGLWKKAYTCPLLKVFLPPLHH